MDGCGQWVCLVFDRVGALQLASGQLSDLHNGSKLKALLHHVSFYVIVLSFSRPSPRCSGSRSCDQDRERLHQTQSTTSVSGVFWWVSVARVWLICCNSL